MKVYILCLILACGTIKTANAQQADKDYKDNIFNKDATIHITDRSDYRDKLNLTPGLNKKIIQENTILKDIVANRHKDSKKDASVDSLLDKVLNERQNEFERTITILKRNYKDQLLASSYRKESEIEFLLIVIGFGIIVISFISWFTVMEYKQSMKRKKALLEIKDITLKRMKSSKKRFG